MKFINRKCVSLCSIIGITIFGLLPFYAFSATFEARIGHLESSSQTRHVALEKVAKIINKKTLGEVELILFPSAQLGNQRQMTESVQLGVIQGTVAPAGFLGGFNNQVSILDIPFLLPLDRSDASTIRNSEFGQALLDSFTSKGVKAISLWPNGRKNFTSNKPITSPENFAGQKFRVMNSKILIEQFSALDASAIALPFGELYTSLQTGVIDGQENASDTISRMKFNEVQKYMVVSEHGAFEDVVLFNLTWWNKLPKNFQEIIYDTFNEAIPEMEKSKIKAQLEALKIIKKSGTDIIVLNDKQRLEYREIMYPKAKKAYLEFAGKDGEKLFQLYESAYKKLGQKD